MKSAIVTYTFVSEAVLKKLFTPAVQALGYALTNFHLVGSSLGCPDHTIVGIKTSQDLDLTVEALLSNAYHKSEALCAQIPKTPGIDALLAIHLHHWEVIGSYSEADTGEKIFAAVALDYALQQVNNKINQNVRDLNQLVNKLSQR